MMLFSSFIFAFLSSHHMIQAGFFDQNIRHEVQPHSAPYMVHLKIEYTQHIPIIGAVVKNTFCSGALISKNYLLTAAQCIAKLEHPNVIAVLGAHRLSQRENSQQFVAVAQHKVHIKYKPDEFIFGGNENDIALLKLARPIEFDDYIQPIKLPSSDDTNKDYGNKTAEVFSWYHDINKNYGTLHEVTEYVNSYQHCYNEFKNVWHKYLSTNLCANPAEWKNCHFKSCHELGKADTGAPLVIGNGSDTVVIGIFSSTTALADPPRDKFTAVNKYLDWIKENSDVDETNHPSNHGGTTESAVTDNFGDGYGTSDPRESTGHTVSTEDVVNPHQSGTSGNEEHAVPTVSIESSETHASATTVGTEPSVATLNSHELGTSGNEKPTVATVSTESFDTHALSTAGITEPSLATITSFDTHELGTSGKEKPTVATVSTESSDTHASTIAGNTGPSVPTTKSFDTHELSTSGNEEPPVPTVSPNSIDTSTSVRSGKNEPSVLAVSTESVETHESDTSGNKEPTVPTVPTKYFDTYEFAISSDKGSAVPIRYTEAAVTDQISEKIHLPENQYAFVISSPSGIPPLENVPRELEGPRESFP